MSINPMETIQPQLWADQGGLIGLVILALFVALGMFLWSLSRIYSMHREDQRTILGLHAQERKEWWECADERQKETNQVIKDLTNAMRSVENRSRRYQDDGK